MSEPNKEAPAGTGARGDQQPTKGVNAPTADSPKRARVKPLNGFYKLWRQDMERIRQHGEQDAGNISIPTLMAIWAALCDIANDKRSHTFTVSIGIIRTTAGVARSTAFLALDLLEKLGMVNSVENKRMKDGKPVNDPSTYTIYPTEKAPKQKPTQSDKKTTHSSGKKTTGSPSLQAVSSDTALKNLTDVNICKGDKKKGSISSKSPGGAFARLDSEWGPS